MATPICKIVDCNVINQELAFYEDAHCLLDGEPGIGMLHLTDDYVHFTEPEIEKLDRNSVSGALWKCYSGAEVRLREVKSGEFTFERVLARRSLRETYEATAIQWEKVFLALLTDPKVPVRLNDLQSRHEGPGKSSVWALRIGSDLKHERVSRPITITFFSSTDLPVPSPLATQLEQFLTEKVRAAGITLPRGFVVEKCTYCYGLRYDISIPNGSCDEI